ncbi:hypothetical protein BS17DRAFT_786081 [Gyrodon lividus]|nr:hypothetical protein BS17DRAFT_786081 [Gyrodon lividus]
MLANSAVPLNATAYEMPFLARMALAKQGVPVQGKQRERVRKTGVAKKIGGPPPKKASKGRVRSEKSIAKRNTKK